MPPWRRRGTWPEARVGSLPDALRFYPLARRLPLAFSPPRLAEDVAAIPETWWERHLSSYHDGGWESISLWAPGGDRRQQRSRGGEFGGAVCD